MLTTISELKIMQMQGAPGYYFAHGNELTDTYHESLEKAMEQAKFEFHVEADEWEKTN